MGLGLTKMACPIEVNLIERGLIEVRRVDELELQFCDYGQEQRC
jgi:hypothetical protein